MLFNFKIRATKKEKIIRMVIYLVLGVTAALTFAYCFFTVYVNSYNIMSEEPISLYLLIKNEFGIDWGFLRRF